MSFDAKNVKIITTNGLVTLRGPVISMEEKAKIEIYLDESELDSILQALVDINKTGKIGDGKIAILDVEQLIRIRTKEEAAKALY